MARYTILFGEYMKEAGRTLPAEFSQIEGFSNLFVGHFCDREIGFETEDLFNIKLQTRAALVMPYYVQRIALLTTYYTGAQNPVKTTYEQHNTTFGNGAQKTKTTELPIDSTTAQPNVVNDVDAYSNTDNGDLTRTESGLTTDEAIRMLELLNKDVSMILEKCLKEFDNLFMQVF